MDANVKQVILFTTYTVKNFFRVIYSKVLLNVKSIPITKILEDRILEYFDLRECQNQIRPLTSDVKNSMSKCRFYKCVSYATLPVRNLECMYMCAPTTRTIKMINDK